MRAAFGAGLLALALSSAGASAQDYRPPSDIPADAQSEDGGLSVRVDRLEAALRRATGQIEDLQNDNRKLAEQVRKFREDVEFRLSGKGEAAPAAAPSAPEPSRPLRKSDAFDPDANPAAPGAPKPIGASPPSAPLTLPSHAAADTSPLKPLPTPPPVKQAETDDPAPNFVPSGVPFNDAREQYKAAVAAYHAGQYSDAESLFKAYLEANKGAANAADAIFYIGETYMQRSRPREAAEQYLKVSTEYAKSPRAPESMVRLGLALARLGNTEQACATFAEVGRRYPTAPAFGEEIRRPRERDAALHMTGSPLDLLSGEPSLLLAVSGGPDSTALLLMAAEWNGGPTLHAATVDHGLRPESAEEAASVGRLAAGLGVPHRVLRWEGEKPRTRIQERAREARYDLLAAEAARVGAKVVVTAHHLDDQAETVLMRLARGSGLAGLAGMAPRTPRGRVDIARPLLAVPKAELVAFCEARGVDFARDPSNENPAFARPRWRRLSAALAAEGLDAPALARLSRRAALAEEALAAAAAAAELRLGLAATGVCDAAALVAETPEIVRRVLTGAVSAWGEPPLDAMERLTSDLIEAAAQRRRFAANVAGALVAYDGRAEVRVSTEPPRRAKNEFRAPGQRDARDDQRQPDQRPRLDGLAQKERAQRQSGERHHVIVEARESRALAHDQLKIDEIGERRVEHPQRRHRGERSGRRGGERGEIAASGQPNGRQRRERERHRGRRRSRRSQLLRGRPRDRPRRRRSRSPPRALRAARQIARPRRADRDRDAAEAAEKPERGGGRPHAALPQYSRQHKGEDRLHAHQQREFAAADAVRGVADDEERDRLPERRHQAQPHPEPARPAQARARRERPQRQRADGDAHHSEAERIEAARGDGDEQEGRTPERRKKRKQQIRQSDGPGMEGSP